MYVCVSLVRTFSYAYLQFEKAHSPLLKDLMLYLKELMKDYRSDVAGHNNY